MTDRALLDGLTRLFVRDLESVRRELAGYHDDAGPWQPVPGLSNAGGTLVLHIVGNLRHFVGAVLGGSRYVRDREAEFAARGVPRAELDALVVATIAEVRSALTALDPARLDAPFPAAVRDVHPNTRLFLLHLATHLTYHLGQLDVHRRVVTGDAVAVDAVAVLPYTVLEAE
jgi:uncharacterized damage-inducible protein DinB